MTGEARDAVASERTVGRVRPAGRQEILMGEEASRLIDGFLPLPHHAVAGVASVVDFGGDRRIQQRLGFALRLKHWIAPGEAHERRAPLAKRRKIGQRRGRILRRWEILRPSHVRLYAKGEIARVVAAGAHVGCVERRRAVRTDDHAAFLLGGDVA